MKPKIKQIYRHPKSGAVVVHFDMPDLNYSSNVNFNPLQFQNMTKEQIKEEIERTLQNIHDDREKQKNPVVVQKIDEVISELVAKEDEEAPE